MGSNIRSIFPNYRVYVFGVDVTDDVTSVTVDHSGSKQRAPSTAEIELVNGGAGPADKFTRTDRYIVTKEDIETLYYSAEEISALNIPELKNILASVDDDRLHAMRKVEITSSLDAEIVANAEERARNESIAAVRTKAATQQSDIERVVRRRIEERVQDPIKQRVMLRKFNITQPMRDGDGKQLQPNLDDRYDSTSIKDIPQLRGEALRYPFQTGDCIFHSSDMVRIFFCDPHRPADWYHMFAGFVTDITDAVTQDDQRTVRIRIEDVTRILRYSRFATNPGVLDASAVKTQTDDTARSFSSEGFAGFSLPQMLTSVIFGADRAKVSSDSAAAQLSAVKTYALSRVGVEGVTDTPSGIQADAIGAFNFKNSFVAVFGKEDEADSLLESSLPKINVQNLAQYQALVDHRVYISDLANMAIDNVDDQVAKLKQNIRKVDDEYLAEDIVDAIGRHPELFPVDYGRLVMLLPGSLGSNNRELLLKDIVTSVATQTTWRSRLALFYDVLERIDFSFFASPRGDLLCEMPLYDFEPWHFSDSGKVDLGTTLSGTSIYNWDGSRERGPYGPAQRVAKEDTISWDKSFVDENILTQMIGIHSLIPGFKEQPTSELLGLVEPVNLYALFPQFGVRSQMIDPQGVITNPRAARLYAGVKLNQVNSNARTASVQILPRVQLAFPNRPLEFVERTFVATTERISHRIVWGLNGSITTDVQTHFVRAWSGQTVSAEDRASSFPGLTVESDKQELVYEPIGGFGSQNFNYVLRKGVLPESVRNTKTSGGDS